MTVAVEADAGASRATPQRFVDCRVCQGSRLASDVIDAREIMYGTMKPFTYLRCAECDTLQISTIPDDLGQYYANDSYYSFTANKRHAPSLKERVRRLLAGKLFVGTTAFRGGRLDRKLGHLIPMWVSATPKIKRDAKIIDIGCGDGTLVDQMKSWGFTNLTGADPFLSGETVTQGGIKLLPTPIEEMSTASYDVLILMHSFEHVPDPVSFMHHIRRVVRDDGIVVMAIPVSQGVPFENYRENWVHLDAPRHLHLFTVNGLEKLARQHKLETIKQGFISTAFSVLGSMLYSTGSAMHQADGSPNFGRYSASDWAGAQRLADGYNATARGDASFFVMRPLG